MLVYRYYNDDTAYYNLTFCTKKISNDRFGFNRKLVANIIYIMCKLDVIEESNVTKLTLALEGNKDSSVRGQLAVNPSDDVIKKRVENIVGRK